MLATWIPLELVDFSLSSSPNWNNFGYQKQDIRSVNKHRLNFVEQQTQQSKIYMLNVSYCFLRNMKEREDMQ